MDYVFIDTSVFISNNFLEGNLIKQLLKLSKEGFIKIVLPEIIVQELKSNISKNVTEGLQKHKKFKTEARMLRNIPTLSSLFSEIDESKAIEDLNLLFDAKLKDATVLIPPYPELNIGHVFARYFKGEAPFGEGKKKNEFPDAFVLASLEAWCEKETVKCTVLSTDQDIEGYESPVLSIRLDYKDYVDEKIKEVEKLKKHEKRLLTLEIEFGKQLEKIQNEVSNWVHEELDDDSKYFDVSNAMDVHHIDVQKVDVAIDPYLIEAIDDELISLSAEAYVYFDVELEIDDENYGYHDDDEKSWTYWETKTIHVIREFRVPVRLNISISINAEVYGDFEIEEINRGKGIKIISDYFDGFPY